MKVISPAFVDIVYLNINRIIFIVVMKMKTMNSIGNTPKLGKATKSTIKPTTRRKGIVIPKIMMRSMQSKVTFRMPLSVSMLLIISSLSS